MTTEDTAAMWTAVDAITEASSRKVDRGVDADWLAELAAGGQGSFCRVEDYRAATLAYGRIPALWDQATWALTTGSERSEGGSSPSRERSPADLDLMETMLTIRESMSWQLIGRGLVPKDGMKAQMRQLAAHVGGHEPEHLAWWTYRFQLWQRLLNNHLAALDRAPKPVYLRNTACPECAAKQVTVDGEGQVTTVKDPENRVVPAIVIDFVDGWIRAAQCQACAHSWFRGDALGELANLVETSDTNGRLSA